MKKGYIMRQRIVHQIDGVKYDFKRTGEKIINGKIKTPKYVELVYVKLPDSLKGYAKEIEYDEVNGKYGRAHIKVVPNVENYMKENIVKGAK